MLSHPTGNEAATALLSGLIERGQLHSFYVSQGSSNWLSKLLPGSAQSSVIGKINCPPDKLNTYPAAKEFVRSIDQGLGFQVLSRQESSGDSLDCAYNKFDEQVAGTLVDKYGSPVKKAYRPTGVFCYEEAALLTFRAARQMGIKCFYQLTMPYWQTSQRLLMEEIQRLPEWEQTLGGNCDWQRKQSRLTEELALADVIVCPSKFVRSSLPPEVVQNKVVLVSEYGSPEIDESYAEAAGRRAASKLRVLFVGAMSQRNGLADLFAALHSLNRADVELVVLGNPDLPLEFYRRQYAAFIFEKARSPQEVLKLLKTCHVLALPAILEGRAPVLQEAMMCGLPLVITPNSGGGDLIEEGSTGFLIPIRSPEKIAEKIGWCADHRHELENMAGLSRKKATGAGWDSYRNKILEKILPVR